jgi:hypothetical protein
MAASLQPGLVGTISPDYLTDRFNAEASLKDFVNVYPVGYE